MSEPAISFSASDAALEGFQLIRRRWRVVIGWAVFNLLVLVMLAVLTAIFSAIAAATGGTGRATVLAGLLVGLGAVALQAILAGGVFRLELRPDQPAFLHLRLGGDELRLVLVWLLTLTGWWAVIWLAELAAQATQIGGGLGVLLALALVTYLSLRFSLTAPVAFAEQRIDFPRSWRLTKGRVLALLGMSALSLCLIALLLVAVAVAMAGVAGAAGGLDAIGAVFSGDREAFRNHPGVFVLAFGVQILLTPVLWVLGAAPLIAAYRAFASETPTP